MWLPTQEKLAKNDIVLDVQDFDKSEETRYTLWKEKLDTLDVRGYDTIIAHSFGCPVVMQYLLENKIHINRLVLVAPSGLV